MNSINFLGKEDFPLDTEGLNFLQDMVKQVFALAGLGGQNYILSGCVEMSGMVSEGLIVISGELVYFAGGTKKTYIAISETKGGVTNGDNTYPEAYSTRTAGFADAGVLLWSSFAQVPTNLELLSKINAITGDAPGVVKMWAGLLVKIPTDYMLCNGDILSVATYPSLFENIGAAHGGDGVNSFCLPDLRQRFIVGYDSSKTGYSLIGNKGGAETVSLTTDQLPAHNHVKNQTFDKLSARASDISINGSPSGIDSGAADQEFNVGNMTTPLWTEATIQIVGDNQAHENRPPFFVLAYIIKVK